MFLLRVALILMTFTGSLITPFAENLLPTKKMTVEIFQDRDYKKAILIQKEKIEEETNLEKKAEETKQLAFLYLKDQDQELAFKTFLKGLDLIAPKNLPLLNDENLYKKAFLIYLDPNSKSPQVTAQKIIKELMPILNEKSNEYLLNYFIAIAYANLGKYEEFFNHFYYAYQYYPFHYLAYKTKAILHIKILERTKNELIRKIERQAIIEDLTLASKIEPLDTTIYRLLISFSHKTDKRDQIQLCLNKIINDNIIIPRQELMFYVIEAVDINDAVLAQRFIDCAKKWYPESRILTSAQKYLDVHN